MEALCNSFSSTVLLFVGCCSDRSQSRPDERIPRKETSLLICQLLCIRLWQICTWRLALQESETIWSNLFKVHLIYSKAEHTLQPQKVVFFNLCLDLSKCAEAFLGVPGLAHFSSNPTPSSMPISKPHLSMSSNNTEHKVWPLYKPAHYFSSLGKQLVKAHPAKM